MNSEEVAVNPYDRESLCRWGYSIIKSFRGVDKLVVAVAISYFDRFLSSSDPSARQALKDRFQLQLVFIASLVIALKVHSGFTVETNFVSEVLCDGSYSVKEITGMENKILVALNWCLNGPTPHDFIDGFLEAIPIKPHDVEFVSHYSKNLAETGVAMSYHVAMQSPSKIAFASMCCSLHYIDGLAIIDDLQAMTGFNFDDQELQQILKTMLVLMQEHSHGSDQSVSTQDSHASFQY